MRQERLSALASLLSYSQTHSASIGCSRKNTDKCFWLFRYTFLFTSSNVSQRLIGFIWSVGYNSHLAFHLFTPRTNSSRVCRSALNMKFILLFKFAEIDRCQ
jgi:hypothetical protein